MKPSSSSILFGSRNVSFFAVVASSKASTIVLMPTA
jgi:hypothetical protein